MCFCVLLCFTACMLCCCNTVGWAWWDWGLIWWLTILLQCFDTVSWVTWPVKISSPNDLYCVEWDVKPYSIQLNFNRIKFATTFLPVKTWYAHTRDTTSLSAKVIIENANTLEIQHKPCYKNMTSNAPKIIAKEQFGRYPSGSVPGVKLVRGSPNRRHEFRTM